MLTEFYLMRESEAMRDERQAQACASAILAEPHSHFVALVTDRLPNVPSVAA